MKLEIWLDYLSPLCYKQQKSIEQLFKLYHFKDLELLYRSYEMIPSFKPSKKCTFHKILSKHHVITIQEAEHIVSEIHSDIKPVKVLDAHRLSHLAKKNNCSLIFNSNVFKAFYEEQKDISNHQVLLEIAVQSGLDEQLAREVLSSELYLSQVQSNRENAIYKGIFELPHMRIDGIHRLYGYYDEKTLFDELVHANVKYSINEYCVGENCHRKKAQ